MAFFRSTGSTRFQGCLLLALAACLPAAVAAPKLPAGLKAVPAIAGVTEAPVSRLMIRYRSSVKLAGQGGATPATERLEAAAVVARTASLAGQGNLHYLKSVSASLHVATLDQAVSPVDAEALMQRLRADPAVLDVEIDRRVKAHFVPNDPLYSNGDQWHLRSSSEVVGGLNASTAWDNSNGGGVVVAVLDGGYRPHADLAPNLLPGYDFVSADDPASFGGNSFWTANDSNARDGDASDPGDWVPVSDAAYCDSGAQPQSSWHGTHVTGIVAALGNNNLGGLGVAFGARILPVRVLGRCGGYTSDILAGARWAAGLAVQGVPVNVTPARVLNLSLGVEGVACDSITQSEIDAVRARNVSIVASSGNDYSTTISLPANCKGVLAVTAHTREGDSADYANVGAGVALSAPGGGTNTVFFTPTSGIRGVVSTSNTGATVPGGDAFVEAAGTSMAAPQVAGVLALVASLRPDLPMTALEEIVINAVRPFPAGGYCATNPNGLPAGFCGSGLLDAQKAVLAAAAYVTPAPSSGGGGCTVAPNGQADAGLVLLGMAALLMLIWRRRSSR